jgi:polysaccharide lyase-like protein
VRFPTKNADGHIAQIRRRCARLGLVAAISLVAVASAQASERTQSFQPVRKTHHALIFRLHGVNPTRVVEAQARLHSGRGAGHELRRHVSARRVRAAAGGHGLLRIRKPHFITGGRLSIHLQRPPKPPPASSPGPSTCTPDPSSLTATGCQVVFEDTGSGSASSVWGSIDCATASRVQTLSGGDPSLTASATPQASGSFRQMSVFDGDDFWGERCELGLNDHRRGPTAVYREGQRRLTFFSERLPDSYPLNMTSWQSVMQMKQAQPSAAGGGAPMLELNARGGQWLLVNEWSSLWSVPAQKGVWTRFAFDVRYSQDPAVGSVQVYVDLNGDGDTLDAQEQSPTFHVATLRRETDGGSSTDGIAPGQSIPSHLRMGTYHDPAIPCPNGCSIDVDNVQVVG